MPSRMRGRLTRVQADGSICHEDNLVYGWRIYKPRGGLAVLVEECRKVVADELVRSALMEVLIVPQPILDVDGDGAKRTMIYVIWCALITCYVLDNCTHAT